MQGADLVLHLRVRPRGAPEGITGVRAGRLLVKVSAAPVDGAANERLMRILARELATPLATLILTAPSRTITVNAVVVVNAATQRCTMSGTAVTAT